MTRNYTAWSTIFRQKTTKLPLCTAVWIEGQILLNYVNKERFSNGCVLATAAFHGNKALVQLLLDRGANINAQGGHCGTALAPAAAFSRGEKIVQLLLDRGEEINAQSGYYGNALSAAVYYQVGGIVQLLLDRGANVNAEGGKYGAALGIAAF